MKIKFLQVLCGDSIFIHFADADNIKRNIIIDTGHHQKKTFPVFCKEVKAISQRKEKIDLLVLTHSDDDHIGGFWKLINLDSTNILNQIDHIWLNHSLLISPYDSKISIRKAVDIKQVLQQNSKCPNQPITTLTEEPEFFGIQLTILSPDKQSYERAVKKFLKEERSRQISRSKSDHKDTIATIENRMMNFEADGSPSNGSSIAFLLKYKNKKALFLADAHASVIIVALKELGYSSKRQLTVDFVKVSHHGSKHNTSLELLSLIDCQKFIFSTNGKNRYNLPDKETLVRIIRNPKRQEQENQKVQIYFNHEDDVLTNIFQVDDNPFEQYNFEVVFPKKNETLTIHF